MTAWLLSLALNLPFLGGPQEYQILVALGCSAPRHVQNGYREMLAHEVLPRLAEKVTTTQVRLTLAPITGRSYTAPARVLETPNPSPPRAFSWKRPKRPSRRRRSGPLTSFASGPPPSAAGGRRSSEP